MKKTSLGIVAAFLIVGSSSLSLTTYAASSGIRSDEQNECAIWLCLPGGFGEGCAAAQSAFISRVTDVDHKGRPNFTPLPDISRCIKTDPNEQKIGTAGDASAMTYQDIPVAYVPEHKICTKVQTYHSCNGGSCITKRKCVSWQTVQEQFFRNVQCNVGSYRYDDFGQVIGSNSRPEYCTKTLHETTVYGDGIKYGTSWIW